MHFKYHALLQLPNTHTPWRPKAKVLKQKPSIKQIFGVIMSLVDVLYNEKPHNPLYHAVELCLLGVHNEFGLVMQLCLSLPYHW